MSVNPIDNNSPLVKKTSAIDQILAYLTGLSTRSDDLSQEERKLFISFDSDKNGQFNKTEITGLSQRIEQLKPRILTDDPLTDIDFNADGSKTQEDLQALQYIVGEKKQSELRLVKDPYEFGISRASHYNFLTSGGYGISVSADSSTVGFTGPKGELMSVIWGDPHVNEGISNENTFHFGGGRNQNDNIADSSFIMPDGGKVTVFTRDQGNQGITMVTGLLIHDPSGKTYAQGVIFANDKRLDFPEPTLIDENNHPELLDKNVIDSGETDTASFVWSQDANAGQGGWAMKTTQGFKDVNEESWGDYLSNKSFEGQAGAEVAVTRAARMASLDGADAATMQTVLKSNSSIAHQDLVLDVIEKGTDAHRDNFIKLSDLDVNNETLQAYANLVKIQGDTSAYDELIEAGVSKAVIEGVGSAAPKDSKLAYVSLARSRKDLSKEAVSGYASLAGDTKYKTALDVISTVLSNPSLDSKDLIRFTAFAKAKPELSTLHFQHHASLATDDRSDSTVAAYEKLIEQNNSTDVLNKFMKTIKEHPKADSLDQLVSSFVGIAAINPEALDLLTKISSVADNSDLIKLEAMIKASNSETRLNAYAELVTSKASTKHKELFESLTDSQIPDFMGIAQNSNLVQKDKALELFVEFSPNKTDKLKLLQKVTAQAPDADLTSLFASTALSENLTNNKISTQPHGELLLDSLAKLMINGVASISTQDKLIDLASKGASAITLKAFTTAQLSNDPSQIEILNNYLSLGAKDAFLETYTKVLEGKASEAEISKVKLAKDSLELNQLEKSRVFLTVELRDVKIAQFANREIINFTNSLLFNLLSPNKNTVEYKTEVSTGISGILKGLIDNTASKQEALTQLEIAKHMSSKNIDSVDTASIEAIKKQVEAKINRSFGPAISTIPGTDNNTNSRPLTINEKRIASYERKIINLKATLSSLPEGSRRTTSILRRIANLQARINSIQAAEAASEATENV